LSPPDTFPPQKPALFPDQPGDSGGPVFAEPWEAQAFVMAVSLQNSGLFTWEQWTRTLSTVIAEDNHPDLTGKRYYEYWLSALEQLVAAKTPISSDVLETRKNAWDKAARATPHGQVIELGPEPKH